MSDNTAQQPGLVTGHAKLAGGAVEAALGNLTGNTNLQSAGEQLKQGGVSELKAYQDQNPPSATGNDGVAGKLEERIGSAVGCEGMVSDAQGTSSATTGSSGTISAGDKVTPSNMGGMDQPGHGTGGATPGAGSISDAPGSRLV